MSALGDKCTCENGIRGKNCLDYHKENAAHFEMDLFSAKHRIKELEAENEHLKVQINKWGVKQACHPYQPEWFNVCGMIPKSCDKCGKTYWEKPDKKDGLTRMQEFAEKMGKKDDLAERLSKVMISRSTLWDAYADEARKWAVEQVEKCKDELIRMLKDGRG